MFHNDFFRNVRNYKINVVVKIMIISDFVIISAANLFSPIFALFITQSISLATLETVGMATAIRAAFEAIFEIPIARLMDRTKTEKDDFYITVFGNTLAVLVYLGLAFCSTVWQLYALQALLGIASAMVFPGWCKVFTRHADKDKAGVEWSFYDILIGFGRALAASLGAILALAVGFRLLFVAVALLTLLGTMMLMMIRKKIYLK